LFLDLETFPNIGYTWGKYDQNVIRFTQEGCIATFAAKWLDGPVFGKSLPDYRGYKPKSYDDAAIVKDIWKLLDEADIVVAHNGDDFDLRVCKARFIFHGLTPPAPFKTVDTKKVAKKVARFNSNKLDDLGQLLGIGKKIKTDFDLWQGCIEGDPTSWNQMLTYNKKDVVLLEKMYKRLLPWMANHPNYAVLDGDAVCPKCGSREVHYRGYAMTQARQYRRFQCKECGGWGREVRSTKGSGVKTTNIN
jgi:hypothetical protein